MHRAPPGTRLVRQAGLTSDEAAAVLAAGHEYVEQLAKIDDEASTEIAARFGAPPLGRPLPGGPPGTPHVCSCRRERPTAGPCNRSWPRRDSPRASRSGRLICSKRTGSGSRERLDPTNLQTWSAPFVPKLPPRTSESQGCRRRHAPTSRSQRRQSFRRPSSTISGPIRLRLSCWRRI